MLLAGDKLGGRNFSFRVNRAGRRRIVVVDAHLGDVHHDADPRRIGQDVLVGQYDGPAGRRRPPVEPAVGVRDFLGRHAEPSPDIQQRVALLQLVGDQIADDIVLATRQRERIERPLLEFVLSPRALRGRNRDQRDEKEGGEESNRSIDEAFHELPDSYRQVRANYRRSTASTEFYRRDQSAINLRFANLSTSSLIPPRSKFTHALAPSPRPSRRRTIPRPKVG